MRHLRSSALLLAGLWAAPAFADCPRAISATQGIVLTSTTPAVSSTFRQTPAGLSEARVETHGDRVNHLQLAYLHGLAVAGFVEGDATFSLIYDRPTAQLDDLPSHKVWVSDVELFINAVSVGQTTATLTYLGAEEIALGDCRYLTWIVEDRTPWGNDMGAYQLQLYAPDLGVVLRTVSVRGNGEKTVLVGYDQIALTQD